MKAEAILFDFDGVLADTMEDLFLAWEKAFLRFGVRIKREDYFPLEGTRVPDVAKIISQRYNLKADTGEIVRLKEEFYLQDHSFSFYPGVTELIDALHRSNAKIAIVSASTRSKLEKTIPKEFLKKFDAIISGDDVSKGKPDREPYLTAAKKLGVEREECVVIENAPLGVRSAKNAGMFCIAITSTVSKEALKEADVIIQKFDELKDLSVIKNLL